MQSNDYKTKEYAFSINDKDYFLDINELLDSLDEHQFKQLKSGYINIYKGTVERPHSHKDFIDIDVIIEDARDRVADYFLYYDEGLDYLFELEEADNITSLIADPKGAIMTEILRGKLKEIIVNFLSDTCKLPTLYHVVDVGVITYLEAKKEVNNA